MYHHAANTFLALPELLEHMLLQLPIRDILLAQRVCKFWAHAIKTSPSLQTATFLRPTKPLQLSRAVEPHGPLPCASCSECNQEYQRGDDSSDEGNRWVADVDNSCEHRIVLNPIFEIYQPWKSWYHEPGEFSGVRANFFESDVYRRPEASWRKMLFTQPPLSKIFIMHRFDENWNWSHHWHWLQAKERPGGLTLGDVYENWFAFEAERLQIWGEEDFAWGIPPGSTDASMLENLVKVPHPKDRCQYVERDDDEGSEHQARGSVPYDGDHSQG